MNVSSEQVFLVDCTESQHAPTPLQRAFAMPVAAMEPEDVSASTSICRQPPTEIGQTSRTNMCRLCATITEFVVPIFEGEGLQNNLADKIHQHLPIQVSENDMLPVVMCFQCTSTLLAWHELVVCAVQADNAMRERFNLGFSSQTQQQQQTNVAASVTEAKDEKTGLHRARSTNGRFRRSHENGEQYEFENFPVALDGDESDEDDRPLAKLAAGRESEAFLKFHAALVRFRDHVARSHAADSADSGSASSASSAGALDVDAYDDLSHRNMRRDRLDDATRAELAAARRRVGGKLSYRCAQCGKELSSAHTYVFHRRIHTGERPCVCHVCGKTFRAPGGLQRHLTETHLRARRPACRTCRRTFANAQNLRQHVRIHTGERPHACARCGKTFAQAGSLHAHARTHEPTRPHACAECGARFRLRAGLTRHRLRHSGERPHACEPCGRAFRARHELAAHRLAHGGARPHACALCPAAFRQRRALRHHARRLHSHEPPPPPLAPPPPPPPPLYDRIATY